MNCRICQAALPDFVEGTLTSQAVREMEDHVAGCPACRLSLALARRIEIGLASQPRRMPPHDFTARVLAALPVRPLVVPFRSQVFSLASCFVSALALILGFGKYGPSLGRLYAAWSDRIATLTFVLGLQTPETAGEPGWTDLLVQWLRDRGEDALAFLTVWMEQFYWLYNANTFIINASIAALALVWVVYDYRRQRARA